MRATITLAMDNAAFADDPGSELQRILGYCAQQANTAVNFGREGYALTLMDANGAKVGTFLVEGEGE